MPSEQAQRRNVLGGSGRLPFQVSSTLSHARAVKKSQACLPKANAPSLLPGALSGFYPHTAPPPPHHRTNDLWRASGTRLLLSKLPAHLRRFIPSSGLHWP